MKKMTKLIALTALMSLFAGQAQGQEFEDSSAAYYDSGRASYLSAALPVGALAVAAVIIATTDHHHSHHNNNGGHNHGGHAHSSHQ